MHGNPGSSRAALSRRSCRRHCVSVRNAAVSTHHLRQRQRDEAGHDHRAGECQRKLGEQLASPNPPYVEPGESVKGNIRSPCSSLVTATVSTVRKSGIEKLPNRPT